MTEEVVTVSLSQAMSMVEAWSPGFGFQLHGIARVLYEEVCRLQADLSTRLTEKEARTLVALTDEPGLQEMQEKLIAANDKLIERNDEVEKLKADYAKLDFQTRAMGVSLADKPDGYGTPIESMPLTRVIDLMDGWRDDVECWGLHQMCRRLRQAFELQKSLTAGVTKSLDDLESLLWIYEAAQERALAAIPCAREKDNCLGPEYRYAACCDLRVALLPGESFHTDYLADSGEIHLFKPANPKRTGAPLVSAGCVKLIEPTLRDDTFDDDLWIDALNLSCTET